MPLSTGSASSAAGARLYCCGPPGVQTVAAIGVGLAGSFWLAVIFFLFVAVAVGVTGPVKQAYIHEIVPSSEGRTVISFDSMVGNAGGVLGQSGLGYLSRARSIEEGYVAGGIARRSACLFPCSFFCVPSADRTDIIVGKRAGRRATCAAPACRRSRRWTQSRGRQRDEYTDLKII